MYKELIKHKIAYSILFSVLTLFVIGFYIAWPNRWVQRVLAIGLGVFYVIWGVVAHVKTKKITQRVILEYVFVSLLASGILFLLTV